MNKLRRRLERLETATATTRCASPPFPAELAGVYRNVFVEAFTLEEQGRMAEFTDEHRTVWSVWTKFDLSMQESGFPYRLEPWCWLL